MRLLNWAMLVPLMLVFISCEKNQSEDAKPVLKAEVSQNPLDYEIYQPQVEDQYLEFKKGIIEIFNGSNESGSTEINRAIWLYEAGLSELLIDHEYNDGDDLVEIEREVTIVLDEEGRIPDAVIVEEFTSDYQSIREHLESSVNQSFILTDVQFMSLILGKLNLKIVHTFYVNAYTNRWDAPNVKPATVGRYAGSSRICGVVQTSYGAWEHVQKQAVGVMPFSPGPFTNSLFMDTRYGMNAHRHIDGSYLLGQLNAIFPHHIPTATLKIDQLTCVIPTEQDVYAQAIADQLYDLMGKRNYWNGIKALNVIMHTTAGYGADWWYSATMGNYLSPGSNDRVTAVHLNLD